MAVLRTAPHANVMQARPPAQLPCGHTSESGYRQAVNLGLGRGLAVGGAGVCNHSVRPDGGDLTAAFRVGVAVETIPSLARFIARICINLPCNLSRAPKVRCRACQECVIKSGVGRKSGIFVAQPSAPLIWRFYLAHRLCVGSFRGKGCRAAIRAWP